MRAAYITAGAAGMYCGSCLHDNTLASALQRMGHDVALIPTYTPIRTDEPDVSVKRVFYGAINVYLEQKIPLFRFTPRLVDRLVNGPWLLNWVSRIAASTSGRDLGALALSVLQGEQGNHGKELDKLVAWLGQEFRPEIVHITNSMLVGLARRIKAELKVPVLCSVQGEDIFLDELVEPFRSKVHDALRERAQDVDGFVATSGYYAEFMSDLLAIPPTKMHEVKLGLRLDGHGEDPRTLPERPFVVGYLARICPEKGLHLLLDAFRLLAERAGRGQVRLRIAGYLRARDRPYLEKNMARVKSWGLKKQVDYVGEVDRVKKIDFLDSIHVLSVPTVYKEPKGLYVLEALANGVPVVQPRHGAFPEMIQATGGGLLVDPESAGALAGGLRELMGAPATREALGRRGKEVVHRDYSDTSMAMATLKLYQRFLSSTT